MLYWANINNVKVGPLEPGQLIAYGLTPETFVWRQGWQQWCKAKFVDEFIPWFGPDPRHTARPPMPSSYLPWALIVTILCCMPIGIVAIIYSSKVESRYASGDYIGSCKASEAARTWSIVGAVSGLLYCLFFGSIYLIQFIRLWH